MVNGTREHNSRRYIDTADVAKMVRRNLRARWPGVKFSVRSRRYAGGSSIDVRWIDGPTEGEVGEVLNRYAGASFDGMIDLKSYHDSVITGEDGQPERVHFGADFVHGRREYTPPFLAPIAERVAREYGLPVPEISVHNDGTAYVGRIGSAIVGPGCDTLADWVNREAHKTSGCPDATDPTNSEEG